MDDTDRMAVQQVDRECPIFYGLSWPELTAAGALCLGFSLLPALITALAIGAWTLPLVLFAGTAGGVRLCATLAARLRDGKPPGWLERQIAWQLRFWLLPARVPVSQGRWVPWRLHT